jgi:hypothetical protein
MSATRGVRGIVAGLFLMSIASVGVIATTAPAGAGEPMADKNCNNSIIKEGNDSVPKELSTDEITREISFPSHCATLEVTKVVTGTPPSGTEFSVGVDCAPVKDEVDGLGTDETTSSDASSDAQELPPGNKPPFTTTLTFPENGGTQSVLVWAKHPSQCTVSETPPAGCTLTSIDPVTTDIGSERTATESAPKQEPDVHPVTVTNNCEPPPQPAGAGAAVAVVTAPRFTG